MKSNKKNSDSDYKAEDEGSATDGQSRRKVVKKGGPVIVKLNKKQLIQQAIDNFLPEGVTISKDANLTEEKYKELQEITEAPEFSLNYKAFLGKVIKVVDGDTIKAVILLDNNKFTRFTFRLDGLDTPQTRRGEVKEFGKKVKEIVTSMIENKVVRIEAGSFDKYGRILARIHAYEEVSENERRQFCLNDFLIENDLAKTYHGKSKVEFSKDDFEDFEEKYEFKEWPSVINFPFEL